MLTKTQWSVMGRYAATAAGSALAGATTVGLINAHDSATLTTAIGDIQVGVAKIFEGVELLIPIAATWYGIWKSSHKQQVETVKTAIATGEIKGVAIQGTPTK